MFKWLSVLHKELIAHILKDYVQGIEINFMRTLIFNVVVLYKA
jgi:hypothetical protein